MNPIYFMSRAINVMDVIDHTTKPLTTEAYLDALGDDGMMLEAVTLEEIVATYMYGLDTPEKAMMEAITTTKARLPKTMAAFGKALNQQMNGSGMEAGEAQIKAPAKSGQIAVMTALFPLSDGQSISVVFHSPSGDPGKIVANDDLVAFRFLLNKRDVTHVVAPSGGQDISLKQTCLTLSNLAERNSAKFQSKQAETKAKEAELATLQASTEQMQAEAADVIEKADQLAERAAADSQKEADIKAKLDKQVAKNEELRRQLAGMGGDPVPSQTVEPASAPEQGGSSDGSAALEPAAPAEPEQAAMPTDTIRKVNRELNMDGESTLSNGAKISKVLRDEDGELEGYITLTEPGGKSYVLKSPSSQGGPMGDAAKKLYKAYREGKAEKYLGTVPAAPEVEGAQPADQDGDTAAFDEQWASAKSIIQEILRNRYITKKDELADIRKKKGPTLNANLDAMEAADPERFKAVVREFDKEIKERGVISMVGPIGKKTKAARKIAEVIEGGREEQEPAQATAPNQAEQTPEVEPAQSGQQPLHWYGLKVRPLSNGAQPAGHADYIAPEDARLASVAEGRPATDTRWGAVAYAEPLSDEQVSQYELVDLSSASALVWDEQTRASKFAELSAMTNTMLQDGDSTAEIWQQVMTPNSPQVEKNPFYVDGKYETTEVTKAFQEAGYTGAVKSMFNQLIDQQLAAIEQANKSPEELEEERKAKALQDGLAALNSLKKGARVPAGWKISIDDDFGDYGSIQVDAPDLPNGEEHEGYLVTANANDAGELDGTFELSTGNGDPISSGHTEWSEISKSMQADYHKDEAAAEEQPIAQPTTTEPEPAPAIEPIPVTEPEPVPAVDPVPAEPTDGAAAPAENQWGETDPEVLALLQQAEELRTTETNPERYLAELQRIGGELDKAGAVERHEPYLHTVSDRLTELMEAEGV